MNGKSEANGGTTTAGTAVTDASPATTMIRVEDLHRSHGTGAGAVHALRGVTCSVPRGEPVALRGRSGSGKTTLLNLIGGLDIPDSGRITVDDTPLADLTENELLATRRDRIGFVLQSFGLIPTLRAAETVGVPLRPRKVPPREREARVALLLSLLGLADHAATAPPSAPASSPAANSSASPTHAPPPTAPPCSSPTNPRGNWTPKPAWR